MSEDVKSSYDLSTISSGVSYLKDGYIEYAEEIISNRALPNIYDGLKPVHRRIIVTLKNDKTKGFIKSARVDGNVLALHPHGNASVYQAMVLMTDRNGTLAFPLLEGNGNFGGVYKTDPAAADRYTEVKLHSNAEEYFGEMNGINMIPNFDSTLMEPTVLPVSFPAVLVNSTSGIAVGFKSNIPSFNFNDVCDLVTEYIKDGYCHTVIAPDFVTGGYYVENEKELERLMKTGLGRIKLRSKYIVNGKEVSIIELPYGKTIQRLVKQVNDLNHAAIRNAYDADDFSKDCMFIIDCTNKNRVEEAMYSVFKKTDLQCNFNADITVVKNGAPVRLGVWNIIDEWVQWRREVLRKEYVVRVEACRQAMREANAFMAIVNNYEKRMELVRLIASSGRNVGKEYIRKNFTRDEVPEDLIDFVAGRSLPSYHDGGKYANLYLNGKAELDRLESELNDIDSVILRQMQTLKAKYGSKLQRRTEITDKDYNFEEDDDSVTKEKIVDTSFCFYELKDGFLKKMRKYVGSPDAEYSFDGTASDTLIAFDNRGRLLRVYCQDIPISDGGIGTYLPAYFNLDETDDYRIMWIGKLDGSELMLLYKDGNVGFVDTSEWIGNNRNVKVLEKGISLSSAPYLGAVFTEIPEMLFVADDNGCVSWTYTKDIKHKDRTAKTRVFDLYKKCLLSEYMDLDITAGALYLGNLGYYQNKLKPLNIDDLRGDPNDFTYLF